MMHTEGAASTYVILMRVPHPGNVLQKRWSGQFICCALETIVPPYLVLYMSRTATRLRSVRLHSSSWSQSRHTFEDTLAAAQASAESSPTLAYTAPWLRVRTIFDLRDALTSDRYSSYRVWKCTVYSTVPRRDTMDGPRHLRLEAWQGSPDLDD